MKKSVFLTIVAVVFFSSFQIWSKPANSSVDAQFILDSDWHDGYTARLIITNNTKEEVTNWKVKFDFPHNILEIWSAKVVSHTNDTYVIENEDWNGTIKSGQSTQFGFKGTPGDVNIPAIITVTTNLDNTDETVILVYRTMVNAYQHVRHGNDWSYQGDKSKQYFYSIIEFNPQTREYGQAYRLVYYDNKQSTESELSFEEVDKIPKEGENSPYMKYVVGSSFSADKKTGHGEILYGNIVIKSLVDIGADKPIALAKSLKGKMNSDDSDQWSNFVLNSRLNKDYTKLANQEGMSATEIFERISEDLFKNGYKPKQKLK